MAENNHCLQLLDIGTNKETVCRKKFMLAAKSASVILVFRPMVKDI